MIYISVLLAELIVSLFFKMITIACINLFILFIYLYIIDVELLITS